MTRSLSLRKIIQKFKRLGFTGPHSGGRHLFMEKNGLRVHIPNSHEGDLSKGYVSRMLREAGISPDEWGKV